MSRMIHRRELVQLLSGSLGADKGQALVMEAAVALQLSTIELSYEQALQLLERVGREPGIVAITAGLAKVRLGRLMKSAGGAAPSAEQSKPPRAEQKRPLSEVTQRVTLTRPQSGLMHKP